MLTLDINELPFVSVCTPTYNRRPFIENLIKCFDNQTYPKEKIEWIIVDDGTDKIEDLVTDLECVKYYKFEEKMALGKKRNTTHKYVTGDIVVYFDDDDYYPPERIEHAVEMLLSNPTAIWAGSNILNLYFHDLDKIYQFGPYNDNHATAATFAFRKEVIEKYNYEDDAALAEEKFFLQNYSLPHVSLDTKKTILVFAHRQNTFDKKAMLIDKIGNMIHDTDLKIEDFIKDDELLLFYKYKLDSLLTYYQPGSPEFKEDVMVHLKKMQKDRTQVMEDIMNKQLEGNKMMQSGLITLEVNGEKKILNRLDTVNLLREQQSIINNLKKLLENKENNNTRVTSIQLEVDGNKLNLKDEEVLTILKQQQEEIVRVNNELNLKNSLLEDIKSKLIFI
jgi:glycosyltransferase involved in cell wall biosynthesis